MIWVPICITVLLIAVFALIAMWVFDDPGNDFYEGQ